MPLNEADTRAKLIDPALYAIGWTEDLIRREETAGAIEVIEGKPSRKTHGRIDYTLRVKVTADSQPVAVALIEAKAENLPPGHGLEQAKAYAASKRLNVSFVYSSNGHQFVEFDRLTGLTSSPRPISEFPSPVELRERYEQAKGFRLDDPVARPLLAKYSGGEATRRYYQDAAIRAVFEKIARCDKEGLPRRALLSLATGAGKTFIAVHLLKRIGDAGQLRRALFVCDRDELRSQAEGALQNIFGNDAVAVSSGNPQKNARILVATYQTLDVDTEDATANFLTSNYPENYFSHIIIDECHRSAWGKWSQVLTRNPDAVQVGLTATPREIEVACGTKEAEYDAQISADNIRHFGEPVYEYGLGQGIDDGYLAACEIFQFDLFHDHKEQSERDRGVTRQDLSGKKLVDAQTGAPVSDSTLKDQYSATSIEDRLLMPERVGAMAADLFAHLLATGGPEQKTIIFCRRDRHADDVAIALNNLYAKWCEKNGRERREPYAFKCTAASGGNQYLADLRGASRSHFIATTVDLLTTGVDVPAVGNIVFFKYVRSPIAFYQMIGRGTRIDIPSGKLMFRVYDYTDATRLFGADFITKFRPSKSGPTTTPPPPPEPTIRVEGVIVQVTSAGRYIVVAEGDGKPLKVSVEEYRERLAIRLVGEAKTLEAFRSRWIDPPMRRDMLVRLPEAGRSARVLRQVEEMDDFDLYDVLAELGYGLAPKRRAERADAFGYKHAQWLAGMPSPTSATIRAIAAQFARSGTEGLENPKIFETPDVVRAGGIAALTAFGRPVDVLRDTKVRMFTA